MVSTVVGAPIYHLFLCQLKAHWKLTSPGTYLQGQQSRCARLDDFHSPIRKDCMAHCNCVPPLVMVLLNCSRAQGNTVSVMTPRTDSTRTLSTAVSFLYGLPGQVRDLSSRRAAWSHCHAVGHLARFDHRLCEVVGEGEGRQTQGSIHIDLYLAPVSGD